jgi:hypothetical protein
MGRLLLASPGLQTPKANGLINLKPKEKSNAARSEIRQITSRWRDTRSPDRVAPEELWRPECKHRGAKGLRTKSHEHEYPSARFAWWDWQRGAPLMARAWDAGRKVGRWDREPMAPEEERRIQAGIDATMRDVIRDAKYNPNALDGPISKVVPAGAPVVRDLPEPLLPGAPTPGPLPWDWIRLGAKPEPKEEEPKN